MPLRRLFDEEGFLRRVGVIKRRAAQSRREDLSDRERPRDVFHAVGAEIAAALAEDGFRYVASAHRLTRSSGWCRHDVLLGSSHYNVAGEHVALSVSAMVSSKDLGRWRERHSPVGKDDRVAGGQLGNLTTAAVWVEWDLADPRNRADVMLDVVAAIRRVAFPFFDRWTALDLMLDRLLGEPLPLIARIDRTAELYLFRGRRDDAARFLSRVAASYGRERLETAARLAREDPVLYGPGRGGEFEVVAILDAFFA